jgi:hypothetical protein
MFTSSELNAISALTVSWRQLIPLYDGLSCVQRVGDVTH